MWEAIKRDFISQRALKERFWNFGFIRGVYLIFFGLILHFDATRAQQGYLLDFANDWGWWPVFGEEQVIKHLAYYIGFWSIVEGVRQAFMNSVKAKVELNQLVEERKKIMAVVEKKEKEVDLNAS
jgi:uncharacterized membrane protein HdeD (DUF308 family)